MSAVGCTACVSEVSCLRQNQPEHSYVHAAFCYCCCCCLHLPAGSFFPVLPWSDELVAHNLNRHILEACLFSGNKCIVHLHGHQYCLCLDPSHSAIPRSTYFHSSTHFWYFIITLLDQTKGSTVHSKPELQWIFGMDFFSPFLAAFAQIGNGVCPKKHKSWEKEDSKFRQ